MNFFLTYILNLALLGGFLLLIYRSASQKIRPYFFPIIGFKCLSGILLGLLYFKYYHEGDTVIYYETSMRWLVSNETFWSELLRAPKSNEAVRAILFIKILTVLRFITGADYWLSSLYFSTFSSLAAIYLISVVRTNRFIVTLSMVFVPSILFWTSGVLKECLAYAALLFLLGIYLKFRQQDHFKIGDYTLAGLSLVILISLKYYVAALFIPAMVFALLWEYLQDRKPNCGFWRITLIAIAILTVPSVFFAAWLHPHISPEGIYKLLTQGREVLPVGPGEFAPGRIDQSLSPLKYFGYLFTGLFRPIFPEGLAFPDFLAGLENLLLVTLLAWKVIVKQLSWRLTPGYLAATAYVLTMAFFMAFSVETLGTLSRLKVYYLPFLWFWILQDHPITYYIRKCKWLSDFE